MKNRLRKISTEEIKKRMLESPDNYFQSGFPNARELLSGLCSEAVASGGTEIEIVKKGNWWVFSTNLDWITPIGASEYFSKPLKYDVGPSGGMRMGLLISVFTINSTFTRNGSELIITGGRSNLNSYTKNKTCSISFEIDQVGLLVQEK